MYTHLKVCERALRTLWVLLLSVVQTEWPLNLSWSATKNIPQKALPWFLRIQPWATTNVQRCSMYAPIRPRNKSTIVRANNTRIVDRKHDQSQLVNNKIIAKTMEIMSLQTMSFWSKRGSEPMTSQSPAPTSARPCLHHLLLESAVTKVTHCT